MNPGIIFLVYNLYVTNSNDDNKSFLLLRHCYGDQTMCVSMLFLF